MQISRRKLLRVGTGAAFASATGVFSNGALAQARSAGSLPRAGGFYEAVDEHPADMALDWYTLALDLARDTPGFTPPVVARAFGYMGVALYETLQPGLPAPGSLAGRLNDYTAPELDWPHSVDWRAAGNAALATIIRRLFPTAPAELAARVDALEQSIYAELSGGRARIRTEPSVALGQAVAEHVFAWSMTDGGHEGYLTNFAADYIPPTGDGLWVPTPPGFQAALQPYWSANRPFVLESADQFDPGPPPAYSTAEDSAFYAEAWEVYEAVNNLTSEERAIAIFWADDPAITATPPGHSISIATQVLALLEWDLAGAAEAYLKCSVAVADAFISCWATKYKYNLVRPITYIQEHINPNWGNPLPVDTPPFPEYTSGHSVQTGAFAQAAHELFGDVSFTDHTHDAIGLPPRSFDNWHDLADETAISRLYGGIHYRAAIDRGVDQGLALGAYVDAVLDGTLEEE